jgi:carboxymethylenebutenolidase
LSNIRELAPRQSIAEDTDAGFAYLRTLADVRGDRQGLIGFCWGGEMTFFSATQVRRLKAVVVFYGRSPKPIDLVKNIESPVLAHYGENGSRRQSGHTVHRRGDEEIPQAVHL